MRRPTLRLLIHQRGPRIHLSAGGRRMNLPALYRICRPCVKSIWIKPRLLTFCRRKMLRLQKSSLFQPQRSNIGAPAYCNIRFPRSKSLIISRRPRRCRPERYSEASFRRSTSIRRRTASGRQPDSARSRKTVRAPCFRRCASIRAALSAFSGMSR